MGHLLYLMFRCDFDVMENLEKFWRRTQPKQKYPIYPPAYAPKRSSCDHLSSQTRDEHADDRDGKATWTHGRCRAAATCVCV